MSERQLRRASERREERERRRSTQVAKKAAVGTGAVAGATVLFAPAAEAATFTVSNLNDAGAGSLRQALIDANATAGADTVVFASGLSGTITLATGQLPITEAVDLQGPGAAQITVDADYASRIFYVQPVADEQAVRIAGLTLFNGYTADNGGALYSDNAELTLDAVEIRGNTALYFGGGVYSDDGSLTITGSTIANNLAALDGDAQGGGVYVDDTDGDQATEVVIRDSTFRNNESNAEGGGIYIDSPDGATVIERSTFRGNRADAEGGGIYVDSPGAAVTISDSTLFENQADLEGGGVYVDQVNDFQVTIQNSTVSGNSAGTYGGGVYIDSDEPAATGAFAIRNSTITENRANYYAGLALGLYYGGGLYSAETPTISSTIIEGNDALGGAGYDLGQVETVPPTLPVSGGGFVLGHSLIGYTGVAPITESPAGSNLLNTYAYLGPLTDNGGPTLTHAPAVYSSAVDAGLANGLATDQRGGPRTFDASNVANGAGDGTDIGAVELVAEGTCKGKAATVLFEPGEKITGSGQKDVVVGTDGNDSVNTKGGKDTVCAGRGKDKVKGGGGKDNLLGQAGADKLSGGGGKDKLKGGGGKDRLKGGPGKDKLRGGPGKDKLSGGGGKDSEVQ